MLACEQDGKSGGGLDLETDWQITSAWRLQVILGTGLWNIDVPTAYGKKLELNLQFGF
jgi:hypothetical protein